MTDRELLVWMSILLVVTFAASTVTAWWLIADWKRTRAGRMNRHGLRAHAKDLGVEPRRFERYEHLRKRVRDAMTGRPAQTAAGSRHHAR